MTVAPDPDRLHPVTGQERVVFLKALVTDPTIEVGEYTYYDDPDDPVGFERRAVLYAYGPERLIIGPAELVTEHARTIMSGTPAELERSRPKQACLGRERQRGEAASAKRPAQGRVWRP